MERGNLIRESFHKVHTSNNSVTVLKWKALVNFQEQLIIKDSIGNCLKATHRILPNKKNLEALTNVELPKLFF